MATQRQQKTIKTFQVRLSTGTAPLQMNQISIALSKNVIKLRPARFLMVLHLVITAILNIQMLITALICALLPHSSSGFIMASN